MCKRQTIATMMAVGTMALAATRLQAATPPAVTDINPVDASGSPITFTATFNDAMGNANLSNLYLLWNSTLNTTGACWVIYLRGTNTLYLMNDAGSGFATGSVTPGVGGGAYNSQCTIGDGGPIVVSGNTLKLPVAVTFASVFTGWRNVYGLAAGYNGLTSGWQLKGKWTRDAQIPPMTVTMSGDRACQPFQILGYAYSPAMQTFSFTKNLDNCTPLLSEDVAMGRVMSTIVITTNVVSKGLVMRITLTNAVFKSAYRTGSSQTQETVEVTYSKMDTTWQ